MSFQVTPVDVLFGRTKEALNHPGTAAFRALVEECLPRYHKNVSRTFKTTIATEIMRKVKSEGGRFMRFCAAENRWKVISDKSTRDTVTQNLRDLRRAMEDDQRCDCHATSSRFGKRLSKKRRIPILQKQGTQASESKSTSSCDCMTTQQPFALVQEELRSLTVPISFSFPSNTEMTARFYTQENAVSSSNISRYGGADGIGFVDVPQYRRRSLQLYEWDDKKAQGYNYQHKQNESRDSSAYYVPPPPPPDDASLSREESWCNGPSHYEQHWRFQHRETSASTLSARHSCMAGSYHSMSNNYEGGGDEHIGVNDTYCSVLDNMDHVSRVSGDDNPCDFNWVANQQHHIEPLKFRY